jgi:hypothetical protein
VFNTTFKNISFTTFVAEIGVSREMEKIASQISKRHLSVWNI